MSVQLAARIVLDLAGCVVAASIALPIQQPEPLSTTIGVGCQVGWLPTFDGLPGVDGVVRALVEFDDGTGPAMYAAGSFLAAGGQTVNSIAKWDGVHWSALGAGMQPVYCLAVYDDGGGPALYAGGAFSIVGGSPGNRIAKWDGTTWSPLLSGISGGNVNSLAVFNDGAGDALYVGGNFTTAGVVSANHVARWNGTSWAALGSGVGTSGQFIGSMTVFDDGTGSALYVGGNFSTAGSVLANSIAKWDGAHWAALGAGVLAGPSYGWVNALATFDDGLGAQLYAAGIINTAGGVSAANIAKWDGGAWTAVGSGIGGGGGAGQVHSLAVFDNGSSAMLYAGGRFNSAGSVGTYNCAAWNGAAWSSLGGGVGSSSSTVYALAPSGTGTASRLFVGGEFNTAGTLHASGIAAWNGVSWTESVNGDVYATTVFDDGSGPALIVGGAFTVAGQLAANRIAKWDGTAWSTLGAGPGDYVRALAVFDDGSGPALYAGGDFTGNVARWDGVSWTVVGAGFDGSVFALTSYDAGQGPALYAGGYFGASGGTPMSRLAKWNGTSWSSVGGSITGGSGTLVQAFSVFNDGTGPALYVGGTFTSVGGVPATGIAKWNGTAWSALGTGISGYTISLAVCDDGTGPALYAGGLLSVGSANGIARWNGTTWSALGNGTGTYVRALAAFDDGGGSSLIAGGSFTSVSGVVANYVARWDGANWWPMGSGMNDIVMTLASYDDGSCAGPGLFAGGAFTQCLDTADAYLARWGCSSTQAAAPGCMQPHCFGDGISIACPCNNTGGPAVGCANSGGQGAVLAATGYPSLANDTVVLTSSGELPTCLSIFLQGSEYIVPVRFGDGALCTGGVLRRLFAKIAVAGVVTAPEPGDLSVSAQSAALGDPLALGSVRSMQTYYRDQDSSFCPIPAGNTYNVSSGILINWAP